MIWLILLFIILFVVLLLSMPLIVEANGRLSVRGAVVHARLYLLGLIPIPLRLRVYLLASPRFTLIFGKRRVFLLKKRKKKKGKRRIRGIRLLRLDTKTTVGVEGEPAVSVQLAGTIAVLLSMLTTRVAESGSAAAGLSENTVLRITAKTQAIVYLLPLTFGFVLARGITQSKSANNTRKTNEKRTTYASS